MTDTGQERAQAGVSATSSRSCNEKIPSDDELRGIFGALGLVTRSERMLPVLQKAWKVARVSDAPVLIEGETGSGKMVLAKAIHQLDPKRGSGALVTVQCATIQETVAESELFGHRRGSFSGAVAERKGLFRTADGGTIFLDDVGDLPATMQPKLLDFLQRHVIRPVGSDEEYPVDARTVSSSNVPLDSLVAQGRFRADLFYRLDVIRLHLPPLRERLDDLAPLVLALAKRHEAIYAPISEVEPALLRRMRLERFPGNIRELEHLVERMLFVKHGGTILSFADWPDEAVERRTPDGACAELVSTLWNEIQIGRLRYEDAIHRVERGLLGTAVRQGARTRRETAALLQMSERNLYKKLRALGAQTQ